MGGAEIETSPMEIGITQEMMREFMEMKARQEYKVSLSDKDLSPQREEKQQLAAVSVVRTKYDIIRVRSMDSYYYRERSKPGFTYQKADDKDRDFKTFIRDAYHEIGIITTGRKITATVETLKEEVCDEVETIDDKIIEVCPGFYWDGHLASLTDTPSGRCFVKLFDNTGQSSPSTIEVDINEIKPEYIKGLYKQSLKWLEMLDGDLPTPKEADEVKDDKSYPLATTFDFIETWACDRPGVYNDMLKAAASVFMKNKPMGAFILTGLKRNGKSSFVKMMHTMLGRANTSSLRLADLSSRHRTLTLLTSLMNAPDEETEGKDMDDEATANFKSMAAHESVLLPVMYSPKPQYISTNFTMFCPMNTDPEWKGNSASACNQRSLIIPFHADLSRFDNSGKDFARETFTAWTYEKLLAVLFAIATYYKDKPLTFSDTMKQAKQDIEENTDSRLTYARLFTKWFVGYRVLKDVWVDYRAWCNKFGYNCVNQKSLGFALKNLGNGVSRTNLTRDYSDDPIPAYRLGNKKGDNFFVQDDYIPELKATIGQTIYLSNGEFSGNSVIFSLEQWLERKNLAKARDEFAKERLLELEGGEDGGE